MDLVVAKCVPNHIEQMIQGCPFSHRNVVNLPLSFVGTKRRSNVRLNGIGNVAKVATGFAIAMD